MTILFVLRWIFLLLLLGVVTWLSWRSLRHDPF
jgi:hypothetical protein